jgi:nitronate monooxygenase
VLGADLAYVGSAFIATNEARASDEQKQGVVAGRAKDIVGSTYFTGIFGNYLKPSIVGVGLDPDNLPARDPSQMDMSAKAADVKVWRDIWGSGQGIGAIKAVVPVAELVGRLARDYAAAKAGVTTVGQSHTSP